MAETLYEIREIHESQLTDSIERELTDEQLQQLAEGSCSWGANCNKGGSC
ncbi:MAG TPA: hypothetical protein VF608_08500 [Thermoanaerobaculia bacterium]|jgi:hypothetical protein